MLWLFTRQIKSLCPVQLWGTHLTRLLKIPTLTNKFHDFAKKHFKIKKQHLDHMYSNSQQQLILLSINTVSTSCCLQIVRKLPTMTINLSWEQHILPGTLVTNIFYKQPCDQNLIYFGFWTKLVRLNVQINLIPHFKAKNILTWY